jgi:hypothetical protein
MRTKLLLFLFFSFTLRANCSVTTTRLQKMINIKSGKIKDTDTALIQDTLNKIIKKLGNISSVQELCHPYNEDRVTEILLLASIGRFFSDNQPAALPSIEYNIQENKFTVSSSLLQKKNDLLKIFSIILVIVSIRMWHMTLQKRPNI